MSAGLLLALVAGVSLDFLATVVASDTNSHALGAFVGLIPGVLCIFLSRRANQSGFGQGLLAGGCVVALIGGACGWMVGTLKNL